MKIVPLLFLLSLTTCASAQDNWKTLKMPDGFEVKMPLDPVEDKSPPEKEFEVQKTWNSIGPEGICTVIFQKLKEDDSGSNDWEKQFVAGVTSGNFQPLLEEDRVTVSGWPAIQFTVSRDDGTQTTYRVAKIDKRFIVLAYTYLPKTLNPETLQVFVHSLIIPKEIGQGTFSDKPLYQEYPVDDTGLIAQFPKKPVTTEEAAPVGAITGKTITCQSEDGLRVFCVVHYSIPVPESKDAEIMAAARQAFIKATCEGANGKNLKVGNENLGSLTAVRGDFDIVNGMHMRVFCFNREQTMFGAYTLTPIHMADSRRPEEFFKSLHFGK